MQLQEVPNQIEITIMEGSFSNHGPMDETNTDNSANSMECQLKKRSSKYLVNDDRNKRVVSGTCNVCAAPCSSCMHLGMKSPMDSNVEETFSEINLKKETDQFSCVNCEGEPICKCRPCDNGEHETSEGSNFSVISSHHLTENAESKITIKIHDDASKDVNVPSKVFLVHESGSADGMDIKSEDPYSVNTQSLLSSVSKANVDLHSQSVSIQGEEKNGQGCRRDNISFNSKLKREIDGISCLDSDSELKRMQCSSVLTGNLPSKNSKKTQQIQTSLGVNDVPENGYGNSDEPNNNDESLMYSSGYNTKNDGPSKKPHQSDCLQIDDSSQIKNSSFGGSGFGSEKIEEKFSSLRHQSTLDNTKVSQDIVIELNDEDGKIVKNIANANNEKVPLGLVNSNRNTDEKTNAAIGSKPSEPSTEPHQVSENESESDILEDVKVCDICGDAGREEALAICSRCSDGAEHIYCMRIMMTELPKGDWLCEECKLKEDSENKKVALSEKVCRVSIGRILDKKPKFFGNVIPSNDLSKPDKKTSTATSVVTPMNISKFDNKVSTVSQSGKEFQNSISASNRILDNLEVTSTCAKVFENKSPSGKLSGPINLTVEKSTCESSLNSQGAVTAAKVKPSNFIGVNNLLFVGNAPTPSGLKSSDIQAQIRSPRDIVSKSSFNNLKPKNKSVTDIVSPKTKLLREATKKIDGKREGIPLISKSESFKSTRTNHVHVDSIVKNQTCDARILTQGKEKSILERKKSFTDHPRISSSLVPPTKISCSKKEPKAAVHDRNLCVLPEANILISNKEGPDVHGSVAIHKMKQQTPYSEKNGSSNEPFTLEDQKQCRRSQSSCSTDKISDRVFFPGSSQSSKPTSHDMKNKSISLGNTRPTISTGKIVKCQRCNETGHATQSCSIDKIRCTALKPTGNRNTVNKPNRWKDIIEASISKGRIQNRSDQTERSSLPSASSKKTLPVKDTMLDSSHSRNLSNLVGTSVQESFGKSTSYVNPITNQNEIKFKSVQPMNVASSPRSNSIISSNLSKSEPLVEVLTKEASLDISTSAILAVPKKQWIWQGCFEIHRSGKFCHLCDGVQAHISSFASAKVVDVTSSFPRNIQLEEVPCSIACPLQFRQKSFTNENIALFFYAVDSESHQKYYTKLVDNMLKNDLLLKGKLDGFELLIFPSNKLPEKSQCWNGFYYLWGVFKRNSVNYSEQKPDSQKLYDSPITLNVNSIQQGGEELSTSGIQVKMDEETKSTRSMDLDKLPSCGTQKKGFHYDLNENFQDDHRLYDEDVLNNTSSLKKQRTCSFSNKKQIVDLVGCDAGRLHFSDLNDCTISLESMKHSQENQSKFLQNVQSSGVVNSSCKNKVPFLETSAVNRMQNLSGYEKERTKANVPFIELETVPVEDKPQENDVHGEFVPWDARHGMMRNFLDPQLSGPQDSSDSLNKAMPQKQNKTCSFDQSQRVNKKMKLTDYKNPESYPSPVNWGSLTEPILEKNIPLPVAVDSKKSSSVVPSLVGNDHDSSDHAIILHSSTDEDNVSPDISLSLAAPLPKDNNLIKTEQQVLSEKRTSFVLFGKIIDA